VKSKGIKRRENKSAGCVLHKRRIVAWDPRCNLQLPLQVSNLCLLCTEPSMY